MEDGNCEVVVCDVLVCIILDEVHVYWMFDACILENKSVSISSYPFIELQTCYAHCQDFFPLSVDRDGWLQVMLCGAV